MPTHVVVVRVAGSARRCIVASVPNGDTFKEVAWAAEGRIVYADTNYTLFGRDRTGKMRRIGYWPGVVGNGEPVFSLSRDGRQVAFTANCNCKVQEGTRVGLVSVTEGRVWWLSRRWPGLAEDPSFSPNGQKIAFETPDGIAVEPAHGGQARMVPLLARCLSASWSPNGRWIACLSLGGGACSATACSTLVLIDTHTGETRSFADSLDNFAWSPNSIEGAFEGPPAVIGTLTISGAEHVFTVSGLRSGELDPPTWSPDGKRIAFSAINEKTDLPRVYVIRPNGRDLTRVG